MSGVKQYVPDVVLQGSCQVLKQLRGVTAKLGIRKHETTLDEIYHLPHTGTSVRGGYPFV